MKTRNTYKLDKHIEGTKEFWRELEVHCVAECCGLDAFDFSNEVIDNSISFYDRNEILKGLKSAILEIERSDKTEVSSYIFNAYFKKQEAISFLGGILKNIEDE